MKTLTLSLVILLVVSSYIQNAHANEDDVEVRELNWLNSSFLSNQRTRIDELTRRHFGVPVRGNYSDLNSLQRLIDEEVIARDDTATLQALGVVLGDVFAAENTVLEWRILDDELGSSHAICVVDSQHCLFPVTMLSRRIEVGLNPSVEKVYKDALTMVKPHFPKRPFSD